MARRWSSVLPPPPRIARRSYLRRRFLSGVDGDGGSLRNKARDRVIKKRKDVRKREEEMRGSGVAGVHRTVKFSPAEMASAET